MAERDPPFSTTLLQIRAARAGDQAAREALFSRYQPRVRALIEHRLGSELRGFAEIDDVLQESMLDAYRRIEHFRDEADSKFIQWLAKIVENNIRDLKRRYDVRHRRPAQPLGPASSSCGAGIDPPANGVSPSQSARGHELEDALAQALAQLNPRYRKIILMREMRKMSYDAIADELGYVRAETPRQKLAVAKRQLRALLQHFAPGSGTGTVDS
ncbi:MAG: sigma-70 family RNA polymerase sigma factor [Planctomycetota bacterium]